MKIKYILIVFLMLFLSSVYAFDVSATPEKNKILQDETASYTVKIENASDGIYSLTTSSQNSNWLTFSPSRVDVENGKAEFKVFIKAPRNAAPITHGFPIIIRSISDSENVETITLYMIVKSKEGIKIEDVTPVSSSFGPDEPITMKVNINSDEPLERKVDVIFDIKNPQDELIKTVTLQTDIPSDSISDYEQSFIFENDLNPGEYPVSVTIKDRYDTYDTYESSFEVKPLYNIIKDKQTSWTFFSIKNVITVTNNGNTPAYDVKVTDSLPKFWSLFVTGKKDAVSLDTESERSFVWNLAALNPNETEEIRYSIALWPIYLVAMMFMGLSFKGYTTFMIPTVTKGFTTKDSLKHGKHGSILIHVKNKGLTTMDNVVLEDVVPSSFKILSTSVPKPKYKKTRRGYHLRWNLGTLAPGEERVFTYKIKSLIGVLGNVELPKANMIANGTKNYKSKTPRTRGDSKKERI